MFNHDRTLPLPPRAVCSPSLSNKPFMDSTRGPREREVESKQASGKKLVWEQAAITVTNREKREKLSQEEDKLPEDRFTCWRTERENLKIVKEEIPQCVSGSSAPHYTLNNAGQGPNNAAHLGPQLAASHEPSLLPLRAAHHSSLEM
ncbi:unnamed protein product [Pleuronectes platessa]|uniref:Uncharacterized protein n=1 Tax=Pleuronectes platessa TaxID=8262 RepID=A0A9N7Z628_PLEPL|nr:unnamed protein product [Pleuronectes platessa]